MQNQQTIHYPTPLTTDSFEHAIKGLQLPGQRNPTLTFAYGELEFAPVDVLVSSLFLYNELAANSTQVTLHWGSTSPAFRYAERMGFFHQLNPSITVLPHRPPTTGTSYDTHLDENLSILELTRIVLNDRSGVSLRQQCVAHRADLLHARA